MSEERKTLPKPSVYDELFPGRFLRAGLLKGRDVTLSITDVELELLPDEKTGKDRARGVLSFRGTDCQLALNRTNGESLKAMFGKNVADWRGKRVTLYPGTDKFGKDVVDAIRVRGSPDLAAPITFTLKLPQRRPREITLTPTGGKADAHAPTTPAPTDAPPADSTS